MNEADNGLKAHKTVVETDCTSEQSVVLPVMMRPGLKITLTLTLALVRLSRWLNGAHRGDRSQERLEFC